MTTDPKGQEVNGKGKDKTKKPRSRKKSPVPEATPVWQPPPPPPPQSCGRSAADIPPENVRYLHMPWIPFGALTLVAGAPKTGKSSFAAWLMFQAQCSAILPGYEESVTEAMIPRLIANDVNMSHLLILDDKPYRLPRDKKAIADSMIGWGACLLILDPVDSYMEDDRSENSGKDVREFLESLFWIGQQANAAVVGIRHPGKDARNIMPGSRAWRAVARSVLLLGMDSSMPPKRYIVHEKDSYGHDVAPQRYSLDGAPGSPRVFRLAEKMEAGMVTFGREVVDPTERIDVRRAGRYARQLFMASPEPLVTEWKNLCNNNGVSDRARREAYRLLGIDEKPGSVGGKWIMIRYEKEWPKWTDERETKQ